MIAVFYNTSHLTASTLTDARQKAAKQDDVVLATFRALGRPASPSEVLAASGLRCPLTSVRRSISNLTDSGLLEKTDQQRMGPFGRPEYLWTVPVGQLPLFN